VEGWHEATAVAKLRGGTPQRPTYPGYPPGVNVFRISATLPESHRDLAPNERCPHHRPRL